LSEGITETLINSLSQLPTLRVVSRSAVVRYKGKDVDAQTAGNELKVRSVLKGDVKQLGDQLVINVELIDTRDNRQIWGEQYIRKFADVLAVQRDIVEEVSGKLRLKLTNVEQQRIAKRTTNNPEAYRLYLKGRYQATKMTRESFDSSVANLRQAIALDPGYALAYSGLAYYYISTNDQILTPNEAMPKAREAALKALAIDDTLVEARVSLAGVYWQYDWDFAKADQEFKRALELDPANGESHGMYGGFLVFIGRCEEGIAETNRGRNLNPLSLEADFNVAPSYYFCRRYDEAISSAHNTMELAPDFWLAYLLAGRAYEQKGDLRAAISEYQRARKIDSTAPEPLMDLGRAYGKAGQRAEAERILSELKARPQQGQYLSPFHLAMVYLGLGDKERALAELEQAHEARSWYMTWLKTAPEFDPVRSEVRFIAIANRIGQQ
jgi:TolB-like protein/Tfp pilus assembly protein PilF